MTSIKISNQLSTTSTTICNTFIDCYMPSANGEFVKVYLYVIRMASCGQAPTIADMADALNNTESDILRALRYWEKQNLLIMHCNAMNDLEFIELLPIPEETEAENAITSTRNVLPHHKATEFHNVTPISDNTGLNRESFSEATQKGNASIVSMPPAKPDYDMQDLNAAFETEELRHLPYEAEILLGHALTPADLNTLYYLHDKLQFSSNLISFLIEHCVSLEKKSMRYIEKTAINWHEHHITTVESARSYCAQYSKVNSAVMRAFGLTGGTLPESSLAYVRKWTNTYGMDISMITEACNRTINAISKPNFKYADKIITSWHNEGITCLAQLEEKDASYRRKKAETAQKTTPNSNHTSAQNRFHNFDQGEDVDYDAFISKILTTDAPTEH